MGVECGVVLVCLGWFWFGSLVVRLVMVGNKAWFDARSSFLRLSFETLMCDC